METSTATSSPDRLERLAEALSRAVAAVRTDLAGSSEVAADLDRLDAAMSRLREVAAPAPVDEKAARAWRHDLRNRLNHLTGPAQFLAMQWPADALPGSLTGLLDLCSQWLEATNDSAPGNPPSDIATPTPAIDPGHILVADDDPENRSLLARLLEGLGHRVAFAENGRQALSAVREGDFDAVLLDIRMPEMDGYAVLEALRESGHLRHTPVIVVTGLQEERDAVRCIEIGAEDFLSRPIRPAFLAARLHASLEKKRLRERVFAQHFTPELAREFARNPDLMNMRGRNAEVSVLFCDIRGFSSISERLGPEATIDWLGGVMGDFSSIVIDHGGVLVDYTGDELLALWGAPGEQPDHARRACQAALDMLARLPDLNEMWRGAIGSDTVVGIGISTGPALVGNIGTHRKFKYGPLGTTVNLGSRIQNATKALRIPLLATGETVSQFGGQALSHRRLGRVRVRNIAGAFDLHELFEPGRPEAAELKALYEEALGLFELGDFTRASAVLGDLLVVHPGDGPSLLLMSRVVAAMLGGGGGTEGDAVWDLPGQ
ncbi:MAG: response regulator [Verrucomicrobiales bacterium]|nr:response regulator [Verrucomicrobiales bacterium]